MVRVIETDLGGRKPSTTGSAGGAAGDMQRLADGGAPGRAASQWHSPDAGVASDSELDVEYGAMPLQTVEGGAGAAAGEAQGTSDAAIVDTADRPPGSAAGMALGGDGGGALAELGNAAAAEMGNATAYGGLNAAAYHGYMDTDTDLGFRGPDLYAARRVQGEDGIVRYLPPPVPVVTPPGLAGDPGAPREIGIVCNNARARFFPARQVCVCSCTTCVERARAAGVPYLEMSPTEFEKHAGMGASKKWKYTLRVESADLQFLGLWMMQHGFHMTTAPRMSNGARFAGESGPRTRGGRRAAQFPHRRPSRPRCTMRPGMPRGPRLPPNVPRSNVGLAAGVAAAAATGAAGTGAAREPVAAGLQNPAEGFTGGLAGGEYGDADGDALGGAANGERAGTPEDAALARRFLNTASPALPKAVRERKAAIREGECYQAHVPLAPLGARPSGVEADDPRCGVLGPGPAELLASVMGPELAAADELPMDAKMDPDARRAAAFLSRGARARRPPHWLSTAFGSGQCGRAQPGDSEGEPRSGADNGGSMALPANSDEQVAEGGLVRRRGGKRPCPGDSGGGDADCRAPRLGDEGLTLRAGGHVARGAAYRAGGGAGGNAGAWETARNTLRGVKRSRSVRDGGADDGQSSGSMRDTDDAPRVTAWKILEGQVMTVTLEHRRLTYTGALTLQPFGLQRLAPTPAAVTAWREPPHKWRRGNNGGGDAVEPIDPGDLSPRDERRPLPSRGASRADWAAAAPEPAPLPKPDPKPKHDPVATEAPAAEGRADFATPMAISPPPPAPPAAAPTPALAAAPAPEPVQAVVAREGRAPGRRAAAGAAKAVAAVMAAAMETRADSEDGEGSPRRRGAANGLPRDSARAGDERASGQSADAAGRLKGTAAAAPAAEQDVAPGADSLQNEEVVDDPSLLPSPLNGPEWIGDWRDQNFKMPHPDELGRPAASAREFDRIMREGRPPNALCAMCHKGEEPDAERHPTVHRRAAGHLGPLRVYRVNAISTAWVHSQCAAWSPEVYINDHGQLEPLADAVRRGRMLKCKICGTKGATLGCHVKSCRSSFHLHCARESGAALDARTGKVICSTHAHILEHGRRAPAAGGGGNAHADENGGGDGGSPPQVRLGPRMRGDGGGGKAPGGVQRTSSRQTARSARGAAAAQTAAVGVTELPAALEGAEAIETSPNASPVAPAVAAAPEADGDPNADPAVYVSDGAGARLAATPQPNADMDTS
ncbi:hypothetical protein WJX81_008248 [Elliptochloris bilobata]|uniref:PHD-type domain-containing protein n=1 Tax=Elliptochloris bilobata TaxID=381761 RepID=A0AAW1QKD0_9CHLO